MYLGTPCCALNRFLRARDGTFPTFDPPGAIRATVPVGINPAGAIAGWYLTLSNVYHGFLRAPDGTFTTFDPPGSVETDPSGINPAGVITGYYLDANFVAHGFLRSH
jgi:hypothetical protein